MAICLHSLGRRAPHSAPGYYVKGLQPIIIHRNCYIPPLLTASSHFNLQRYDIFFDRPNVLQFIFPKKHQRRCAFHAEAEEQGGEEDDACPGENLRRPWGVAFAPDHFHFVDDGDGVGGGDAEGVVEQAVAVFRAGGLDEQGVGG